MGSLCNALLKCDCHRSLMFCLLACSWSESSGVVFNALGEDFMKDTINEVDELLAAGVNVTIYSGQLDLICCTTGTEAWVQKLK